MDSNGNVVVVGENLNSLHRLSWLHNFYHWPDFVNDCVSRNKFQGLNVQVCVCICLHVSVCFYMCMCIIM